MADPYSFRLTVRVKRVAGEKRNPDSDPILSEFQLFPDVDSHFLTSANADYGNHTVYYELVDRQGNKWFSSNILMTMQEA